MSVRRVGLSKGAGVCYDLLPSNSKKNLLHIPGGFEFVRSYGFDQLPVLPARDDVEGRASGAVQAGVPRVPGAIPVNDFRRPEGGAAGPCAGRWDGAGQRIRDRGEFAPCGRCRSIWRVRGDDRRSSAHADGSG